MGAEPLLPWWGILRSMDERMLHALEAQRPAIHERWVALLRVEPVNTPLGQPDALKHMIDYTLNTLFAALQLAIAKRRLAKTNTSCSAERAHCPCGKNPLLAYFVAGEQALLETLILGQADLQGSAEARSAEVQELKHALAHVAHREIETFCAVCQYRGHPAAVKSDHFKTLSAGAEPGNHPVTH